MRRPRKLIILYPWRHLFTTWPDFCHFLTPLSPVTCCSKVRDPSPSSGHVVQTQSYFSTYFSIFFLLLWHIGSSSTYFPDSLQLEVFMWLNCICLILRLSCFSVDLLDYLTQSSLRCEFRKNIIIQIIKAGTNIFASLNTLSKFKGAHKVWMGQKIDFFA